VRIEGTSGPQDLPAGQRPGDAPGAPPPQTPAGADESRPAQAGGSDDGRAPGVAEIDLAAIAEARRLLQAGHLDTPEAARRAAEALLDRGP
jgi:hypothetical protein